MSPLPLQLTIALAWAAAQTAMPAERTPESIAVIAVGDPPLGPSSELADLAHQLRAACRERTQGVAEAATMRARLGAEAAGSRLVELERAYVGAQAAFQADELDSAARTFRGIAAELERLPESGEVFSQWLRVQLRLALAERALNHAAEADAAIVRIVAMEPAFVVDPEQFAPSFRHHFDEVRRRAAAAPKRVLIVKSADPVTVYVNGKEIGSTPATVRVPPGSYRVGGAGGVLRAPPVELTIGGEDREIELDVGLAGAVRLDAGPGLVAGAADRAARICAAGRWVGVDRVLALSMAGAGEERLLVGGAYDALSGSLLREGSIRLGAGATPAGIGALASFLLTGHASPEVLPPGLAPSLSRASPPGTAIASESPLIATESTPAPARAARPAWMRPGAYAAAAAAVVAGGLAIQQALAARGAYADASALVRPDGALVPSADRARYDATVGRGDTANRNAYLAGAGAAVLTITVGVLGYLGWF